MGIFQGFLSIDEQRTSALILCLVLMIIFVIVLVILDRSVDGGIITIIQTLIYGALGVNGVQGVTNTISQYSQSVQQTAMAQIAAQQAPPCAEQPAAPAPAPIPAVDPAPLAPVNNTTVTVTGVRPPDM